MQSSNAPAHRPRASDARHAAETQSRGSVQPVCSAFCSMWMSPHDAISIGQCDGDCANTVIVTSRKCSGEYSRAWTDPGRELVQIAWAARKVDTNVNLIFQDADDRIAIPRASPLNLGTH